MNRNLTKNKRKQRDDLYREWNALDEPYSAAGYGLLARIELVDGNTASAVCLARKAATMSREGADHAEKPYSPPSQTPPRPER